MRWIQVDSPFGPLGLFASEKGLVRVAWGADEIEEEELRARGDDRPSSEDAARHLADARRWLETYWMGEDPGKLPPLDLSDQGDFSRRVLARLGKVPWGKSTSYGELAKGIGQPGAGRAVGQAVHRNPLCPFIACHRVLAAGGRLGGFAGGPEAKRRLLRLEGFSPPRS